MAVGSACPTRNREVEHATTEVIAPYAKNIGRTASDLGRLQATIYLPLVHICKALLKCSGWLYLSGGLELSK